MIVLDASALLAYLFREPGHGTVAEYLDDACISTVNLSEVAGRFLRDGIDVLPLIQRLGQTSIDIVPFNQEHALKAAELIQPTKNYGLSLGDRSCLGLAIERRLPVLTADVAWLEIPKLGIEVIPVR
jgi:ribonuclease VapC